MANIKHARGSVLRPVEYRAWYSMWDRCTNPEAHNWRWYGARGIGVDPAWQSFLQFLSDMGPRPGKGYSLDRIDNAKGYGPGNCRWATPAEQGQNTRKNRLLTLGGETLCLSAWARRAGISRQLLLVRLEKGVPLAEALAPAGRFR